MRGRPSRPPGIAEWEDLLVRVELGPRAVRIALDATSPERISGARDERGWTVATHLAHLARREAEVASWLLAMRSGLPLPDLPVARDVGVDDDTTSGGPDPRRDLRRFAERRARNFAEAQRRGLDVWEWRAEHPELGEVTAYQLFGYLAAHDARHLARIRATLREVG